ncbi:hypothetical protein ACKGJN_10395 [Gillisia sp. Q332]
MENLYTKIPKGEQLNRLNPTKETIQFLLNYSKALHISEYDVMQFEVILN